MDAINRSWARPYLAAKKKKGQSPFFLVCALLSLAAFASAQNFTFSAASSKIITPNGDGKNDFFIVSFFNPQFSQVSGKIYDLKGHLVADMTAALPPTCPSAPTLQCLMWDGTSNGRVALGGVYVYVISSGSEVYDGTVVVIR